MVIGWLQISIATICAAPLNTKALIVAASAKRQPLLRGDGAERHAEHGGARNAAAACA